MKSKQLKKGKKHSQWFLLWYLLPALAIYTMFMAYPILSSMRTSLYEWNGTGSMTFVGLENYKMLFTADPYKERFFGALKNNVQLFVIMTLLQNVYGLVLAVLLTKKLKGSAFFRSIFFAPVTLSVVIVGFLWTLIYNPKWGIINGVLRAIGLESLATAWLGNEATALICVGVAGSWQSIGLSIMMFVAGIQGISDDVYESARIDGCTEWKLFRYITFPLILPAVGMVTILTFIGNFANSFDIIFAMQGAIAGPNYATDVLSTFFYRTSFGAYGSFAPNMGLGSAIAFVMFVIVFIAVAIYLVADAKINKED